MATFSMGKLDAICARLKSSQQFQKDTRLKKEEPDVWRGSSQAKRGQHYPPAHGLNSPDASTLAEELQAQAGIVSPLTASSAVVHHMTKSDSSIPKNNNNNVEATDYNGIAATVQTADSTTSDSIVSSTTSDPPVCSPGDPPVCTTADPPLSRIADPPVSSSNTNSNTNSNSNTNIPSSFELTDTLPHTLGEVSDLTKHLAPVDLLTSSGLHPAPSLHLKSTLSPPADGTPPPENHPDITDSGADHGATFPSPATPAGDTNTFSKTPVFDNEPTSTLTLSPLTSVQVSSSQLIENLTSGFDCDNADNIETEVAQNLNNIFNEAFNFSDQKFSLESSPESLEPKFVLGCSKDIKDVEQPISSASCSEPQNIEEKDAIDFSFPGSVCPLVCDTVTPNICGSPSRLCGSPSIPCGSPSRSSGSPSGLPGSPSRSSGSPSRPSGSPSRLCKSPTPNEAQSGTNSLSSLEPPAAAALAPGRRKSRKATKPQRQVAVKQFQCPALGPDLTVLTPAADEETIIYSPQSDSANRCEPQTGETPGTEGHLTCPTPSPQDPNLSMNTPESVDEFLQSKAHLNSSSGNLEAHTISDKTTAHPQTESSLAAHLLSEGPLSPPVESDSPPTDTPDTKGLVDFAHNTMNELLGIYGFEGSDTKNIYLSHIKNFQSPPPVGEDKNVSPPDMSALDSSKPAPGPFRKRVYTSLSQPAHNPAGVKSEADDTSVAPPPQAKLKKSLWTSKYGKTKKSYHQKVFSSSDFNNYIRRYGNGIDCGGKLCQDLGYRDHYHCMDCPQKVFIRKEEMVRHYKWHKKRQDSLQHGFMRYSPMDDCSKKYDTCSHNGRQTHYHCVQRGCDKVYVSTSDVQMHANFHRKDSAIIQEGFQRFRATEDCGTTSCAFYGQRTTHFHCRRPHCNFNFKNKADMEKHKSYHQKDEVLSRDGFKKFMKYELCPFAGCRYSKNSNHIHCIRPGCQYVLHSTAQLYSHKRKHERREFEHAYRSFRHLQQKHGAPASSVKVESSSPDEPPLLAPAPVNLPVGSLSNTSVAPTAQNPTITAQLNPPIITPQNPPIIPHLTPPIITPQNPPIPHLTPSIITPQNPPIIPHLAPPNINLQNSPIKIHQKPPIKTPAIASQQKTPLAEVAEHPTHSGSPKLGLDLQTMPLNPDLQSMPLNLSCQSDLKDEALNLTNRRSQTLEKASNDPVTQLPVIPTPEAPLTSGYSGDGCIKLEPEDLSMKNKVSLKSTGEGIDVGSIPEQDRGVSVEEQDGAGSLPEQDREISQQSFEDSWMDDEDDDDDDDDKDYGQVEEPTLVNASLEGDQLNNSLNLSLLPLEGVKDEVQVLDPTLPQGAVKGELPALSLESAPAIRQAPPPQTAAASLDLLAAPPHMSTSPQAFMSQGKVVGVALPSRPTPEKRERDESWKKYLIRYTANDACYSRCVCLYKDHYHCRIEGCQVIFKSKDGVRGHARLHDIQDCITPLVYCHFGPDIGCTLPDCPYSRKESHYHCNWTNCCQVISGSAPTFARLEHYRIHDYTTAAVGKGRGSLGSKLDLDPLQKRRGRPPKYPKYDLPKVPKVHLTEREITDSTIAFMHNLCDENSKIINGFKKFVVPETCPDEECVFKHKDHYHCGRKFCHMATDMLDVLNVHAKEFHNNVTILEGFEFYERMVNCRRPVCHNNKINRHFHCTRSRCDYSFVRYSTMAQHNKKHPTVTSAVLSTPVTRTVNATSALQNKVISSQYIPIAPAVNASVSHTSPASPLVMSSATTPITSPNIITPNITSPNNKTVKSAGTFFPLSGPSHYKLTPVATSSQPLGERSSAVLSHFSQPLTTPQLGELNSKVLSQLSQSLTKSQLGEINNQVLSHFSQPLTNSPKLVSLAQNLPPNGGTSLFTSGGVCLALPPNLMGTHIPVITQSNTPGIQTSLLAGLIPVGQLSHQGLANLPATQLFTTPQGHFLHQGQLVSPNVLQLISPPGTSTPSMTPTLTPGTGQGQSTKKGQGPAPRAGQGHSPRLTVLLQQMQQQGVSSELNWPSLKKQMHYSVELNCGRPFCKLKKKDHYHCLDCNQAFSDPARLRAHIGKHGFKFHKSDLAPLDKSDLAPLDKTDQLMPVDLSVSSEKKEEQASEEEDTEERAVNLSLNLQPSLFTSMVTKSHTPPSIVNSGNTTPNKTDPPCTPPGLMMTPYKTDPLMMTPYKTDPLMMTPNKPSPSSSPVSLRAKLSEMDEESDGLDDFSHSHNSRDSQRDEYLDSPSLIIDDSLDSSAESSLNVSSSSLTLCSSLSRKSERKRTYTKNEGFINTDALVIPKAPKVRKTGHGTKTDADLPAGYKRVRCGEDCGHVRCAYRQTVTHFHCLRADCGYGFSDKSRIMQHRIRHERLDTLMGGEFQQFRASVSCERADCEFDAKASHFHCLKCPYSCADSSKVPAHRKYHTKLDNISSNGFTKYAGTADCQIASCSYFRKQTHYHCTHPGCNHAVLGPSQMAPHKLKHAQHHAMG